MNAPTVLNRRLLDQTISVTAQLLMFSQPADAALSAFFRAQRSGPRERAFIAETAYTVLRHRRSLSAWLRDMDSADGTHGTHGTDAADGADRAERPDRSGRSDRPDRHDRPGRSEAGRQPNAKQLVLAALLRHCGISQRLLSEAISTRDAEWLAALKARPMPALALADAVDLPDWLVEKLLGMMTEAQLIELARALNQPAPLDLRVNTVKSDREAVLAQLHNDGLEAAACPYSPLGVRVAGKPALAKYPLFLAGAFEVQDEGSQLLGFLLAPKRGEMVVDFCAGAGGKTLMLGALMRSTGRLYAFDVSEKRLAKLKPRLARSGLSNVHPVAIAHENDTHVKRLAGKCDRVLVDAPCSGLGTLRRNPDLKWRQTPQSVAELTQKQAGILAAAAKLLKPGGRLVYATCSLLPDENEQIVDAFLAAHPAFVRRPARELLAAQNISLALAGDDFQLLPQVHGTDGFYAAVLERSA